MTMFEMRNPLRAARALLGLTALVAALAQFPIPTALAADTPRVAFLGGGSPGPWLQNVIQSGFADQGWSPGNDVTFTWAGAEGELSRLPELLDGILAQGVDLIMTASNGVTRFVLDADTGIPVVFTYVAYPDVDGIVADLDRPPPQVTGASLRDPKLEAERIDLVTRLFPGVTRVAILVDASNRALAETVVSGLRERAARAQVETTVYASPADDLEAAFEQMARDATDAVLPITSYPFWLAREQIVRAAAKHGFGAVYDMHDYLDAGGIASFAATDEAHLKQAATIAGEILRGKSPQDIPVGRPARYQSIVNREALGIDRVKLSADVNSIVDTVRGN